MEIGWSAVALLTVASPVADEKILVLHLHLRKLEVPSAKTGFQLLIAKGSAS